MRLVAYIAQMSSGKVSLYVNIANMLLGICLATLAVVAFHDILHNSFVLEGEDGRPEFYLLASDVQHLHIAFITAAFIFSAVSVGVSLMLVAGTKLYKKKPFINVVLLTGLLASFIYYIVTTPVNTAGMGNVGFTMTDGTVANMVITYVQRYYFYSIGAIAFLVSVFIALTSSLIRKGNLLLTIAAAVAFCCYQLATHNLRMIIIAFVVLGVSIFLSMLTRKKRS